MPNKNVLHGSMLCCHEISLEGELRVTNFLSRGGVHRVEFTQTSRSDAITFMFGVCGNT